MLRVFIKLLIFIFICPTFLVACSTRHSDPDESVVYIIVSKKNSRFFYTGTGFVVASGGYIVTNHHVIRPHLEKVGYKVAVKPEGESTHPYSAEVIWHSKYLDLAILRARSLNKPALIINSSKLEKGQTVKAIGFPGTANAIDRKRVVSTISSHSKGVVSRVVKSDWVGLGVDIQAVQHTATINKGNSGGPLINECDQVVGVNTLGAIKGQGTFFSSHAIELARVLKEQGISAKVTKVICEDAKDSPSVLYIVLLSLVSSILVSLSAVYLFAKQTNYSIEEMSNFILSRKTKSASAGHSPDFIHDVNTQYILENCDGGKDILLDPVSISQNPRTVSRFAGPSNIQIDKSNISSKHALFHCSTTQPYQFFLEDLGSSNGTFVNGLALEKSSRKAQLNHKDIVQFGSEKYKSLTTTGTQLFVPDRNDNTEFLFKGTNISTGQPINIELSVERFKSFNDQLVIGRNIKFCDEVIDDPTISSKGHALIKLVENKFYISDMDSTNGTKVNNQIISSDLQKAIPLVNNMVIHLGSFVLTVEQKKV